MYANDIHTTIVWSQGICFAVFVTQVAFPILGIMFFHVLDCTLRLNKKAVD